MVYQTCQTNSQQGEEQQGPQRNGLRFPYVLIGIWGIVWVCTFRVHGTGGKLHKVRPAIKVASHKAHQLIER